ncbi:MAG: hypothetical protein AB2693_27640, partial [Candidatus Thiodiazotropha sp.]
YTKYYEYHDVLDTARFLFFFQHGGKETKAISRYRYSERASQICTQISCRFGQTEPITALSVEIIEPGQAGMCPTEETGGSCSIEKTKTHFW